MRFIETPLNGAWVIDLDLLGDERGWFARTFDADEFAARGLNPAVVQCNASFNARRGTLRGMHYQAAPHEEAKLVRCLRGSIHDVIIDLRPTSPTFRRHFAITMTAADGRSVYVPEGFAHGFQTLEDDTEVLYQMSTFYVPSHSRGVRWDDPAFGIAWPPAERTMTERDRTYPDFTGAAA